MVELSAYLFRKNSDVVGQSSEFKPIFDSTISELLRQKHVTSTRAGFGTTGSVPVVSGSLFDSQGRAQRHAGGLQGLLGQSGQILKPDVTILNEQMESFVNSHRNAVTQDRSATIEQFVRRQLESGRIVGIKDIAREFEISYRTASARAQCAQNSGLIHYTGPVRGWQLGQFEPIQPSGQVPKPDAMDWKVAEHVRASENGNPATTMEIARLLGVCKKVAMKRLRTAESAGLVVACGYRQGWKSVD